MRNRFDQFGKQMVRAALEGRRTVHPRAAIAPSTPAQPSRFVGWLGGGVGAIERAGTLMRVSGPADRAALAPRSGSDAAAAAI